LQERKGDIKSDVERMRYEGLESMTRKQIDDVEKNVGDAQVELDRNKEKLERINKVLVNSKAGIEHLCEKLSDVKIESSQQQVITVTDTSLVEALSQAEQKLEFFYKLTKNDPLFLETMA
jgi:wobble nucleotide-excising tRNase